MDVSFRKHDVRSDLKSLREEFGKLRPQGLIHKLKEKYKCSISSSVISSSFLPDDLHSKGFIPKKYEMFFLGPKKATGDGNCLYNAVSLAVTGTEDLSYALRLLVSIELYENASFYANHPRINTALAHSTTSVYTFLDSAIGNHKNVSSITSTIKQMVKYVCTPNNYSCLMELFAISSVLKSPVYSIYPLRQSAANIRPLFHGKIYPRETIEDNHRSIFLLWSGEDKHKIGMSGTYFCANHFVPLFLKEDMFQNEAELWLSTLSLNMKATEAPTTVLSNFSGNSYQDNEIISYMELSKQWFTMKGYPFLYPYENLSQKWYLNVGVRSRNVLLEGSYPSLSKSWFTKRGQLFSKNCRRSIVPQNVANSLFECRNVLQLKIENEFNSTKKQELKAVRYVLDYFLENGPVISVKELMSKYLDFKSLQKHVAVAKKMKPGVFMLKLQRHLCLTVIYIHRQSYAVENTNLNKDKLTQILNAIPVDELKTRMNNAIEADIGDIFNSALEMTDSKKDKDILKGLFSQATSSKFVAKLMGIKNKSAISQCKNQIRHKIDVYNSLKMRSRVVRNDMTNAQQYRLSKCILTKTFLLQNKLKYENRGRLLKADVFPELGAVIESIFQVGKKGVGGGLESHSRLTCDTLFRSTDNVLTMPEARKIVLEVAPPKFTISLSTCYNYTNSFREGSIQSRQHHLLKDVNARISLSKPPRTAVSKHVPNLHWSTKNINIILELAEENPQDYIIDSRDAKTIIPGDIQPVQLPGKSWKKLSYEDHTFDQGRTNAVYPMTHLIMVNKFQDFVAPHVTQRTVTRTGQPLCFVYMAHFEHETTFNALNELFRMFNLEQLDELFRTENGYLKPYLTLLVDNGHGEDPDSPLTQMCLIRIMMFMGFRKVSQRAFAEYHSKRNFVERVHAAENDVLSRHGKFDSHQIYKNVKLDSPKHKENMEAMAKDVVNCLSKAKFNDKYVLSKRGGGDSVFDDEVKLRDFLSLSEEKKGNCNWKYSVCNNELTRNLSLIWSADINLERLYYEDYTIINNMTERTTAWKDLYSTTLINTNFINTIYELQPIPDYVRWFQSSGELHYVTTETATNLTERIELLKKQAGVFIPSRIIKQFFLFDQYPPDDILQDLARLCWLPLDDIKTAFQELTDKEKKYLEDTYNRAVWCEHPMYRLSVTQLQAECKKQKLSTKGLKYELVERISESKKEERPVGHQQTVKLQSLPTSLTDLKNVPLADIKALLFAHNICTLGNKDDLLLRLFLLRNNRRSLICHNNKGDVLLTIEIAEKVIYQQLKLAVLHEIHRKRRYESKSTFKAAIDLPVKVRSMNDMLDLFGNLKMYLNTSKKQHQEEPACSSTQQINYAGDLDYETYFEIGRTIKIKWGKEEIGDSGWKPGWYVAEVQSASIEVDEITVVYNSEPDEVYTIEVTPYISSGKIRSC